MKRILFVQMRSKLISLTIQTNIFAQYYQINVKLKSVQNKKKHRNSYLLRVTLSVYLDDKHN